MTTPQMDAALNAPVIVDFVAVEVVLPFATIRLITGASEVTFPIADALTGAVVQATFKGEDPTYGTVAGIDGITEGLGTTAPRLRFALNPPTRAASAQLNLPTNQGWPVRMWYGLVDPVTGAIIPDPEQEFIGWLDQPRFVGGPDRAHAVEYDVACAMELLFAAEEGQRLNHAQHVRAFPGELGLQWVSEIERQLPWGADTARSPMIAATDGNYGTSPGTGNPGGGGGMGGGSGGGWGGGGGGGGGRNIMDTLNMLQLF